MNERYEWYKNLLWAISKPHFRSSLLWFLKALIVLVGLSDIGAMVEGEKGDGA